MPVATLDPATLDLRGFDIEDMKAMYEEAEVVDYSGKTQWEILDLMKADWLAFVYASGRLEANLCPECSGEGRLDVGEISPLCDGFGYTLAPKTIDRENSVLTFKDV